MGQILPRPTFSLPAIPNSVKAGELRTFLEKVILQITQELAVRPPKYEAISEMFIITPDKTKTFRLSIDNAGVINMELVKEAP